MEFLSSITSTVEPAGNRFLMGRLILAVFGAGRAGSIHARNAVMTGRAEIKWIVDAVPNNGRKLSDELPSQAKVVKFGDHDQVLQDKR